MNVRSLLRPNAHKIIVLIFLLLVLPFPYTIFLLVYGLRSPLSILAISLVSVGGFGGKALMVVYFIFSLLICYLISSLLLRRVKFKFLVGLLVLIGIIFSFLPVYFDEGVVLQEHYTLIEQYSGPIKIYQDKHREQLIEKDTVVLQSLTDANIPNQQGIKVSWAVFRGVKRDAGIQLRICSEDLSWLKAGSCYIYKDDYYDKDHSRTVYSSDDDYGTSCYTGSFQGVDCQHEN